MGTVVRLDTGLCKMIRSILSGFLPILTDLLCLFELLRRLDPQDLSILVDNDDRVMN